MERKYYLRGLGLGIAVTAVIMGLALSGNKTMTNDEIIARAKELGMVENTVLADAGSEEAAQENMVGGSSTAGQDITVDQSQDTAQSGQSGIQNGATSADEDEEDIADAGETDVRPESGDDTGEDGIVPVTADDEETGESDEQVKPDVSIPASTVRVITINSGDGSYTVAKKLADVGVVTSAETFDTFLCENGYDKRLRTGNFSIPADASDEQIARIVTGAE